MNFYPVIDSEATGRNILRLRTERKLSVRDLQAYFGFAEPNAIYHWQKGKALPSVDNLYALSELFGVSMNEILVAKPKIRTLEQQAAACCSNYIYSITKKMGFVIEAAVQWGCQQKTVEHDDTPKTGFRQGESRKIARRSCKKRLYLYNIIKQKRSPIVQCLRLLTLQERSRWDSNDLQRLWYEEERE